MVIGEYLENVDDSIIKLLRKAHDENVFNFANHGYTNQKHANLSPDNLRNEIKLCEKIIETKLGRPIEKFYRPGCGIINKEMMQIVDELNYKLVLGDVYPFDPQMPIFLVNFIHIMLTVERESIIILQPMLLKILLPALKKKGYAIKNLKDNN
jgi:peptidoglycan/xylan/chitin deacetylase (PgdA/CDA1 family)